METNEAVPAMGGRKMASDLLLRGCASTLVGTTPGVSFQVVLGADREMRMEVDVVF